jgi:hypothetical protein
MSINVLRTSTLGVLAALVVAAIASASASAALCKAEGGGSKFALCFNEPLELVEGKFGLHITNAKPATEFVLKGAGVEIKCPEILLQLGATLTAGSGVSLGIRSAGIVLHFVKCQLPVPENCKIKEELVLTTTLDGIPTPKAEDNKILFLPEKGITFTTITVEGNGGECLIAGKDAVTALKGKEGEGPLCNAPGGETTTILHLTECTGTTKLTNLKFAGKEVEVKGNVSTLLEGMKTKWAVILGK